MTRTALRNLANALIDEQEERLRQYEDATSLVESSYFTASLVLISLARAINKMERETDNL